MSKDLDVKNLGIKISKQSDETFCSEYQSNPKIILNNIRKKKLMLRLAEVMLQENLISLSEKINLVKRIEES